MVQMKMMIGLIQKYGKKQIQALGITVGIDKVNSRL
jgi:hypothetical protein